ncbi:TraB/GumN family protein [Massilia sp. Leaf139]|uniref:TraB/GumN family protein n=1 Tax=Massilia sp. Leaf139 TaxID=1736272 RepID=UPI0006FCA68B|nr:TraB/GumN family protein [Massilia sp. Leaf139]KQQ87220.1 hypothetical protein ASF77_16665 [Massilia sp. Leaf139]
MLQRVIPALTLCLLSLPVWAQTEPPATPPATENAAPAQVLEEVPQTVLVSGARPGPGLWKVSKGEHVMWVFGTYSPVPKKMEWRSRDVEKIIAGSQEYLKAPGAGFGVGWNGLTALPFLFGVKSNPDGELKNLVPPEVYARWQPLKQKYFDNDDSVERERPSFIAAQLTSRAYKEAGLVGGNEITKTIDKLAEKHKLKVTNAAVNIQIKDPAKAVREFKKSPMDDVPCLIKTIERLEGELDFMRARANAWAVGEIEDIRKLNYEDRAACQQALSSSSLAKNQPEFKTLQETSTTKWVEAAEKALAANTSTFAVVHIKDIFDPKGVIAVLQAKGYTVEPPK